MNMTANTIANLAVTREALHAFVAALADIPFSLDVPMAKRTTLGIGGPADVLVSPRREEELVHVLRSAETLGLPVFFLGGGSNLLVADRGIRGVVVALAGELAAIAVREQGARLDVGAGVTFPRLTRTALDLGWQPAIGWMGTPGQVGGALKMNAGTRDGEIGDVVESVYGATARGVLTFSHAEAGFRYRGSEFPHEVVLTRTILRCDDRRTVEIEELDRVAKELLAKRHRTQPKLRSAGSLFKNPPGDFAGRLIEAAGLKGRRIGQAQISEVHANFFVNLGGATAADICALAALARGEVERRFGVTLEWEVRRVGDFA